jgi:hypothetical protein
MRKVFSVLVLAALATGMVWAQDEEEASEGVIKVGSGELKISGSIKTGLRADGNLRKTWDQQTADPTKYDEKGATMSIYGYSDDADDESALRADLAATYTNGPFGAKINLRNSSWTPVWGQGGPAPNPKGDGITNPNTDFTSWSNHTYIQAAYGWVDLFNNIVSVYGGKIGDDIWGTGQLGGTATDTSYDDVSGVRLAIKPIAPLSFGISLPFGVANAGSVNATKYYQLKAKFAGETFGDLFANSIIGVGWKNDAFAASVSLKLNGGFYSYALKHDAATDREVFDTTTKAEKYYGIGPDFLFGAKLLAVPKLTLILDGEITHLFQNNSFFYAIDASPGEDVADYLTTYDIYLKGEYQITDPLSAGLRLQLSGTGKTGTYLDELVVPGTTDKEDQYSKLDFGIRVFADYAVTSAIKPGLEVEFYIAGDTAYDAKAYDKYTDAQKKLATHGGLSHIYFKPRCGFSMGEGLSFNVWDKITIVTANGLENVNRYTGKSPADSPTELAGFVLNTFQLDFVWSF